MGKLSYILLINCVFVPYISSQNIFQQIKGVFLQVDSTVYIDEAYMKDCQFLRQEEESIKRCYQWTKDYLTDTKVKFLLNIDVDSTLMTTREYVQLDTNKYNFTLIFFDKKWRYKRNICFVNNKIYPFFGEYTGSVYAKKFVSGYKRVVKRNPKYMLYCIRLSSTILYIPDEFEDRIMVYNIWDEKTYELKEYMEKIKNNPSRHYYYREGTIEELGNW